MIRLYEQFYINVSFQMLKKYVLGFCVACCLGKSHQLPSHHSTTTYGKPIELLFLDLWVPAPIQSFAGYSYYLSMVDACIVVKIEI